MAVVVGVLGVGVVELLLHENIKQNKTKRPENKKNLLVVSTNVRNFGAIVSLFS